MKTIKIFIASSNELESERKEMAVLANSLNTVLDKQGIHVIAVEWENLDSSAGDQPKQEDYNDRLRECDICVALFYNKLGIYTKKEFDIAWHASMAGQNPKKLYVYFKDSNKRSPKLNDFRVTLETKYGHFPCDFGNIDTLRSDFLLQFLDYIGNNPAKESIKLIDGSIFIGENRCVNFNNVSDDEVNDKYDRIKAEIEEVEEDLIGLPRTSPRYARKHSKLVEFRKELNILDNKRWRNAINKKNKTERKAAEYIASIYLESHPRNKYYPVTLSSSEDDSHLVSCHSLSQEEYNIIQECNQEWEGNLEDILQEKGYDELVERLRTHNTLLQLDTLASCDLTSPEKFTNVMVYEINGESVEPYTINVPMSDDDFHLLLTEALIHRNHLSMNMLVYKSPDLAQRIMRFLVNAKLDFQFENYKPFACAFPEFESMVNDILNPFTDILHIFDTQEPTTKSFLLSHQIVPESGEIYHKQTDTFDYHIGFNFEGTKISVFEEKIDNNFVDYFSDEIVVNTSDVLSLFQIDNPEEIYSCLKSKYHSKDGFDRFKNDCSCLLN